MKCLRRLEDTDLYFPYDTSSNLDRGKDIYGRLLKSLRSFKELLIHEETYIQLWSISGVASDESASMTVREGKIRETYKLSLQKTPALVKLCLKWHKIVSKPWIKKSWYFGRNLQGLRKKPRRSYNKRN